eukprot:scaffold14247_cov207-Alexandrium_tamarense.AAC.8
MANAPKTIQFHQVLWAMLQQVPYLNGSKCCEDMRNGWLSTVSVAMGHPSSVLLKGRTYCHDASPSALKPFADITDINLIPLRRCR